MPKVPRGVSHNQMVRFLKKRGWKIRPGGKHTILAKDGEHVSVPRHDNLPTGTVKGILDAAGIADWSDL